MARHLITVWRPHERYVVDGEDTVEEAKAVAEMYYRSVQDLYPLRVTCVDGAASLSYGSWRNPLYIEREDLSNVPNRYGR